MLVKGKKLKLPREKIRAKAGIRAKVGPQTPLSLSLSKLLIQGFPSHKFRILIFVVFLLLLLLFFIFIVFVFSFC